MLTEERQKFILDELNRHEIIKIQDIIHSTKASESTCRRDLQELETAGFLMRIHGGARRISALQEEGTLVDKSSKNVHDKELIAHYAVNLLHQDDVIYIDAGTTTQTFIKAINPTLNLTVVTNSIDNASLLATYDIRTILIGGTLKNTTRAIIGSAATSELSNYRFNQAFMGTNSIHLQVGFSTPDPEESAIKRVAIQNSEISYILADTSKFEQISFSKFAELNQCTVITTQLSKTLAQKYASTLILKEALN